MKTNLKNWSQGARKAFTLIELLIVITIIGILAVALLPSVLGAPARARDAARKADLTNIVAGLETYNSDNNGYPKTAFCIIKTDQNFPTDFDKAFKGNTPPTDPQGSSAVAVSACGKGVYYYCPMLSPYNYVIAANMEIKGDAKTTQAGLTATCGTNTPTIVPPADTDHIFYMAN